MSTIPPSTVKPPVTQSSETKKLLAQLRVFLDPLAKAAGKELRPFSLTTFTSMQFAGISVGSADFAKLDAKAREAQLVALLVLQTAPLEELAQVLPEVNGDFQKFFWTYCFKAAAEVPLEAMEELNNQLAGEMPALAAAQIEVQTPDSMAGDKEKPPGK